MEDPNKEENPSEDEPRSIEGNLSNVKADKFEILMMTKLQGDAFRDTLSNVNADLIDTETMTKLRGDAVGDSMYSQSSIIRILLRLSDVQWDKKLEEDLCFLWDATVEPDVNRYLFQLSFPSIATATLMKHTEPRLIEIIVGILANICCYDDVVPDISDVEISIVLDCIETNDHLVLIQIMRFITAVTQHRTSKLPYITSDVVEKICFVLANSTNEELITYTMEALAKITTDFKSEEELLNEDVLTSLLIAYDFIREDEDEEDEIQPERDEMRRIQNYFVQTVLNIALYANKYSKVHERCTSKNGDLLKVCRGITERYVRDNDSMYSEEYEFYLDSLTIIFPVLNLGYDRDFFRGLLEILGGLLGEDDLDPLIELIRYFISVTDVDTLWRDVRSVYRGKDMFTCVDFYETECEFNYKENLKGLIARISEDK